MSHFISSKEMNGGKIVMIYVISHWGKSQISVDIQDTTSVILWDVVLLILARLLTNP